MPKGRPTTLSKLHCNYVCEWDQCDQSFSDSQHFKNHQLDHFKLLYQSCSDGGVNSSCNICGATLDLGDWNFWERHSHFHVWTIELRTNGLHLQEQNGWPPCLIDSSSKNTIPDLPTPFECGWEYCSYCTNDIVDFGSHASGHYAEYSDSRYPANVTLKCLWEDCNYVAKQLRTLGVHLESHVQSKRIACPTCGFLFVNILKFEEHLKRQHVHFTNDSTDSPHPSVNPVRCPRCHRMFATEKYLISHMQRHVNTVKCPLCDMTSVDKTALRRHILYRHSTDKPFACEECEYRCKSSSTLNRHIQSRHCERPQKSTIRNSTPPPVMGPLAAAGALSLLQQQPSGDSILSPFTCKADTSIRSKQWTDMKSTGLRWIHCHRDGCRFKCTTRHGFLIHMGVKHPDILPDPLFRGSNVEPAEDEGLSYACHLCSVIKREGRLLSKHLISAHNLTRPSGHVRFTYEPSDDGFYRLQLTRLDTAPVAAAVLGENVATILSLANTTSY